MDPHEKEELRRLVLAYLAKRPACAFHASSVREFLRREIPCTEPEVSEALSFLESAKYLVEVPNSLGSRRYYQATHTGILSHERGD